MDERAVISLEEARSAVQRRIDAWNRQPGPELVLADEWITDHGWCWTFAYNTRDYLDSGNFSDMLLGGGPFLVEKATGRIHELTTAKSVEAQLELLQARGAGRRGVRRLISQFLAQRKDNQAARQQNDWRRGQRRPE